MESHGAPGETQVDMDGSLISPVLKDGGIWWNISRCLRFLGSLTSVIKSLRRRGRRGNTRIVARFTTLGVTIWSVRNPLHGG